MKKPFLIIVLISLLASKAQTQESNVAADSNAVKQALQVASMLGPNTVEAQTAFSNVLTAALKINFLKGIQGANDGLASYYYQTGKLSRSLQYMLSNEELAIAQKDSALLFNVLRLQASIYGKTGDINMYRNALWRRQYILDHKSIPGLKDTSYAVLSQYNSLAQFYAIAQINKPDSVAWYYRKMNQMGKGTAMNNLWEQLSNGGLGNYYLNHQKLYDSAIYYLRIATNKSLEGKRFDNYYGYTISMADAFRQWAQFDSAFAYAYHSFAGAESYSFVSLLASASGQLAKLYTGQRKYDSVVKYMTLEKQYKDSVSGMETLNSIQSLTNDFQQRSLEKKRQQEEAVKEYKSTIKNYLFIGGTLLLLGIIFLLYRVGKQKERSTRQINEAYLELKATQAQLVQAEKMASLGELTAGIAHEIQNPLNFVNNFSEVSRELMAELLQEPNSLPEDDKAQLLGDIDKNLQKIHEHGKRAESIVRGMLLHSRTSSGKAAPTDLNALCEEYSRLSYHGFRAKDKNFNAGLHTDPDPAVGMVNVVAADIGRVLLNLLTNAFLSVDAKQKKEGSAYKPTVTLATKRLEDKIQMTVTDNGGGIPAGLREKIFQPFFTTRPAGQGTGLGLSLSYDVIKAHQGNFTVESEEGQYAKFIIT
ncbi:MAG: hypothetical protein EOO13_16365, partial [Chitinophagaceae bacterium]